MRKKRAQRRVVSPDIQYGSVAVSRFINYIMSDGKRAVAESIVYGALQRLISKEQPDPLVVFNKAIENASPRFEVVSKRVGGANYQVPREVREDRKFFLACNWIIDAARSGKGRSMEEKLAHELLAAFQGEGSAIKKKETIHKMAEANRAFAHFAR